MIENFHVKDIYGNMIEIVYDRKDCKQYHIIMIEDDATEWAEEAMNGTDLSDIGGYIKPDTFVAPEFYSKFELNVFKYMVRTNYELAWESYIDYVDFLRLLEEADEIFYDKEGIPHFAT